MKTNEERIKTSILRNPDKPDHIIAKNLGLLSQQVKEVRASLGAVTETKGGVSLTGLTVSMRKPNDSVATFIKNLPEERGFHPEELSLKWGVSEETVRKHARKLGALLFVELPEGWVGLVMNPTTAARRI